MDLRKKKQKKTVRVLPWASVWVFLFSAFMQKLLWGQFFQFFSSACGQRASAVPEVLGQKPNEACPFESFCKYELSGVSGV